jgi:hypothetical protein
MPSRLLRTALPGLLGAALLTAAPAAAQDGFLFDEPRVTLSVRGGHYLAAAGSDLYDEYIELLTLDRGDFSGTSLVGEVGVRLGSRFDVTASVGRTSSSAHSESRTHFADPPIAQTTSLRRTPVTATLKYYVLPRGRNIGTNAWIPARLTPFVGVGVGALQYDLSQDGEFVDYESCDQDNVCDIFRSEFESSGWTQTLHVAGGADYWLTTHFGLSADLRYQWASAALDDGFVGFDDLDLRGLQSTIGLSVRF